MTSEEHGSISARRGRMLPFTADGHCSKLHALKTCPLAPRSDNRHLSAHVRVNTSFRQASRDDLCCVHRHVLWGPSSFNTVYSEVWLSGSSIRLDVVGIIRYVLNLSVNLNRCSRPLVNLNRCSQPVVNLNRCSRSVVSVAPQARWLKSPLRPSRQL